MGLEVGLWFILPISHDGHFGVGVFVDVDVFALDDAKFTVLGTVEKGDSTAAGLAMATGSGMFIVVWLIGVEKDASDDKLTIRGPDSS